METVTVFESDEEVQHWHDSLMAACVSEQIQKGLDAEEIMERAEAEAALMQANAEVRGVDFTITLLAAYRVFTTAAMQFAMCSRASEDIEDVMGRLNAMLREAREQ